MPGGVELGRLVEVVEEGFLGGLLLFPAGEIDAELGLGRSSGRVDERRSGGLADVGEDPGDGLGFGENRDKGEGLRAGRTEQGEHFMNPGQ